MEEPESESGALEEMAKLTIAGSSGAVVQIFMMALVPGLFGPGRALWLFALLPFHLGCVLVVAIRGRTTVRTVLVQAVVGAVTTAGVGILSQNALLTALCVLGISLVPISVAMTASRRAVYSVMALVAAGAVAIAVSADGGLAWRLTTAVLLAGLSCAPTNSVLDYRLRLEKAREKAQLLASTDPLTGLANRRGLTERLPLLVAQAARQGKRIGILAADLDHFKKVNDELGHDVGDEVLREAAGSLTETVRLSDLIARTGGEELCVVAILEQPGDLPRLAERVRAGVEARLKPWGTTVSIGGLEIDPDVITNSESGHEEAFWHLLSRADVLLYEVKAAGRNGARVLADAVV